MVLASSTSLSQGIEIPSFRGTEQSAPRRNQADTKKSGRARREPGKVVASICYPVRPDIERSCASLRGQLQECGFKVVSLDNPSPTQITEALQLIPNRAPVFIDGHGGFQEGKHHIVVPIDYAGNLRLSEETKRAMKVIRNLQGKQEDDFLPTDDVLDAIESSGKDSPVWISSCHAGGACAASRKCVGASCNASETTDTNPLTEMDPTEQALVDLMCEKKKFQKVDLDDDGTVSPEELNQYFCGQFGSGPVKEKLKVVVPLTNKEHRSTPQERRAARERLETLMAEYRKMRPALQELGSRFSNDSVFPPSARRITEEKDPGITVEGEVGVEKIFNDKKEQWPDKNVTKRFFGSSFQVEYRDESGGIRFYDLEKFLSSQKVAEDYMKSLNSAWPKACSAIEEHGNRRDLGHDCRIIESGKIFLVEVREKGNSPCITWPDSIQSPLVHQFRLYSPFSGSGEEKPHIRRSGLQLRDQENTRTHK